MQVMGVYWIGRDLTCYVLVKWRNWILSKSMHLRDKISVERSGGGTEARDDELHSSRLPQKIDKILSINFYNEDMYRVL